MNTPFPPPFLPLAGTTGTITSTATGTSVETHTNSKSTSKDVSPSVFIIFAVVALAIVIILFIHRILRVLFHNTHGSSFLLSVSHTRNIGTSTTKVLSDEEKITLINALPLFTLASQLSVLPRARDCAICCDPFLLDAELRLLPACSHAFHRPCVDKWLKLKPSCPICRSSIDQPFPNNLEFSSGSFRLELGSVSRRSELDNQNDNQIQPADPPSMNLPFEHENQNDNRPQTEVLPDKTPSTSIRSYPMDSYNYFVEEEIEIMPNPPPISTQQERQIEIPNLAPSSPPILPLPAPPKAWLQEYIDKIASSASSSFNSIRLGSQRFSGRWSQRSSQRWSHRFDPGANGGVPPPEAWLWDLEAGQNEEAGGVFAFYRWFTGI